MISASPVGLVDFGKMVRSGMRKPDVRRAVRRGGAWRMNIKKTLAERVRKVMRSTLMSSKTA